MNLDLASWFEIIKLGIGALTLISVYLGLKTYRANLEKQREDRIRDADKELLAQAQKSLQWAYDSLTNEGRDLPPQPDRLNWLTCARHLLSHRKLADRIKSETYKQVQAEHEEYWRHKFYLALNHDTLARVGYFSINDANSWPENIEISSAIIIINFSNWQENITDPIDEVDRQSIIEQGNAYHGRAGRGLKAYVKLLERKQTQEDIKT